MRSMIPRRRPTRTAGATGERDAKGGDLGVEPAVEGESRGWCPRSIACAKRSACESGLIPAERGTGERGSNRELRKSGAVEIAQIGRDVGGQVDLGLHSIEVAGVVGDRQRVELDR
jgi:hypothetical protein